MIFGADKEKINQFREKFSDDESTFQKPPAEMRGELFFSFEYSDTNGHRYNFICIPIPNSQKLELIVKSGESLFDGATGCIFVQENMDPAHIIALQGICDKRKIPYADSTMSHEQIKTVMEGMDLVTSEWLEDAAIIEKESAPAPKRGFSKFFSDTLDKVFSTNKTQTYKPKIQKDENQGNINRDEVGEKTRKKV
jgi:hypothetical protein